MSAPIKRLDASLDNILDTGFDTIIDVRSPAEFMDDHVPGAINLPVLDNDERAEIGTIYKQVNPFEAKRAGAAMVARNIARHLDVSLAEKPRNWQPLVYCWRGGQRSGAMAKIFSDIGWHTTLLDGGYKAYRRSVLNVLDDTPPTLRFIVVAGQTGSAKTHILRAAAAHGLQVIDLEGLAQHRGSLLGREPGQEQPCQRNFESQVCAVMRSFDPARPVFIEAESNKVGQIHIPAALWAAMGTADRVTIAAPLSARIAFLQRDYPHMMADHSLLITALSGLRSRYSSALFKEWESYIKSGNWDMFVKTVLETHYDPSYARSTAARSANDIHTISAQSLDDKEIETLALELAKLDPLYGQ